MMDTDTLLSVLYDSPETEVIRAEYNSEKLYGGRIGNINLLTGSAKTVGGGTRPFKLVLKTQSKWERYGDPDSWRREYDFYTSDMSEGFKSSFRWPKCYRAEFDGEQTRLWLESIDGASGSDMTVEMYVRAAAELGRFQGRLYADQPAFLRSLRNISKVDYVKDNYMRYRSWDKIYDYIRSSGCEIPGYICQMLTDFDNSSEEIFGRINNLPIVLCHRDYWKSNIFCTDNEVMAIDWDTAGSGYMGEDVASLIAGESDASRTVELYQKCVPAYYGGFSEYANMPWARDNYVLELIIAMFGYRLVESFMFSNSPKRKMRYLDSLQNIYEIFCVSPELDSRLKMMYPQHRKEIF